MDILYQIVLDILESLLSLEIVICIVQIKYNTRHDRLIILLRSTA